MGKIRISRVCYACYNCGNYAGIRIRTFDSFDSSGRDFMQYVVSICIHLNTIINLKISSADV